MLMLTLRHNSYCSGEYGSGMFQRMKNHVNQHVSQQKGSMFQQATTQVRTSLMKMGDDVRKAMLDRADSIYLSMQRDYMSIIGGVSIDVKVPRQERALRRNTDDAITLADEYLQQGT